MKNLKLYEKFNRGVVSYDFDGVLHRSVDGIHPLDMLNWRSWEPFIEMHDQMRKDAIDNDIIVVTARPDVQIVRNAVDHFIDKYDLPVSGVYYTNNQSKEPYLKMRGAWKHYDDNPNMTLPSNIKLILVDPMHPKSVGLSEMMNGYKANGIVLLYGKDLPNNEHRLYACHVKNVLSYDRKKNDGTSGQSAKMVLLDNDTYRVCITPEGKLETVKVSNGDKAIGLLSRRIVLNKSKTPLHWLTTECVSFGELFAKFSTELRNLPNVLWYN